MNIKRSLRPKALLLTKCILEKLKAKGSATNQVYLFLVSRTGWNETGLELFEVFLMRVRVLQK